MSLKEKNIKGMIKDESMGNRVYLDAAKKAKTKADRKRFRMMAKDERRHRKYLKELTGDYK